MNIESTQQREAAQAALEASERAAYKVAKASRANELRGVRVKRYNAQGLDLYSLVWGEISVLRRVFELAGNGSDPVTMRQLAAQEAEAEFAQAIAEHGIEAYKQHNNGGRDA